MFEEINESKMQGKIQSDNEAVKNESKHSSNSIFNVTLLSINDKLPNSRVTRRRKMQSIFLHHLANFERKNPKNFLVVIVVVARSSVAEIFHRLSHRTVVSACGESGEGKVFRYTNLICNLTKLFLLRS